MAIIWANEKSFVDLAHSGDQQSPFCVPRWPDLLLVDGFFAEGEEIAGTFGAHGTVLDIAF
jgi:hypothetical protein